MKCFLACFGLSKNQKRRKPPNRIQYADQIHGSYEPLESNVKINFKKNGSEAEPRCSKGKAIPVNNLNKKVSFNLNVKSYEPLPLVEFTSYLSDSEDDICQGKKEETARTSFDSILDDLERETYHSDHSHSNNRYQNWRDSDDDMVLEESDLDNYGTDDNAEEMSEESEATQVDFDESGEGKKENAKPLVASLDQELKKLGFDSKAKRDRSEYVFSVLNPIENVTQWKAVKAKRPMVSKQSRKENTQFDFHCKANTSEIKHMVQHTEVNTSLSNWLAPSK